MNWLEISIYAGVALFLVLQLLRVLGRREGHMGQGQPLEPRTAETAMRTPGPADPAREDTDPPRFTGPAGYKLRRVYDADKSFDPDHFLDGAKAAHGMIIQAFADGDREMLAGLLQPSVLELYENAIAERKPDEIPPRLQRLKHAEIRDAEVRENLGSVSVSFEAELALGEGVLRATHELWTFERPLDSQSPNWLLAAVTPIDA